MRVVIDLQSCQAASRFRGIGRYSSSLAKAMLGLAGDREVFVLLSSLFPETIEPLRAELAPLVASPDHIVVFDVLGPVAELDPRNALRTRAAELVREHAIAELAPDVVHVSSLFEGYVDDAVTSVSSLHRGALTVVTLYDLIPLLNPSLYLENLDYKHAYERKLQSLARADLLLAISESAREEVITELSFPRERTANISAAVDHAFSRDRFSEDRFAAFAALHGISEGFILYPPGGFDPRKNVPRLISAYAALPEVLRKKHKLVIPSQISDNDRRRTEMVIRDAGLAPGEVVLPGFVSDESLVDLYSTCRVCALPSLHEGFGLPALEAMGCGAAVIGSETSSMPEAIGLADALFDPYSVESIAALLQRAVEDDDFNEALRAHGRVHHERFSWSRSAELAWQAIDAAVAQRTTAGLPPRALGGSEREASYARLIAGLRTVYAGHGDAARRDGVALARCIAANRFVEGRRRFLIDVSELVERDARTGIQRVVRAIATALLEEPPSGFVVELVYRDRQHDVYRAARALRARLIDGEVDRHDGEVVDIGRGDVYLGLDLDLGNVHAVAKTLRGARLRGAEIHFVVYDLLLHTRPDCFVGGAEVAFRRWLEVIGEHSDGLVAISDSVRAELSTYFDHAPLSRRSPLRLGYFHLGADIESSRPTDGLRERETTALDATKTRPTILMVGTIEPRKGHRQALRAFEELWARGGAINLVIVGKQGWSMDETCAELRAHPESGHRLFWLESASDEALRRMYDSASVLLCASEGEGFGLPLIEAAQHGLRIISRDLPVFREVAGHSAYYFSGSRPADLREAIERWLELYARGEAPEVRSLPWITWKQSAEQLLATVLRAEKSSAWRRSTS